MNAGGPASLLAAAISGVLKGAQSGRLPLSAWTLGLPQSELLALVARCFPEYGPLEPMPARQYDAIRGAAPDDFAELAALLEASRSPGVDARQAGWLARAVAAASMGSGHLWQDLGLHGRDDVSRLLEHYFGPLYRRNTGRLKWKRFLYAELGARQGRPQLRPPQCGKCAQYRLCFPFS